MPTGFVWHERYMWHDTGTGALGYTEPGEHWENPDTKRRFKNLLDLTGLSDDLVQLKPRLATEDELGRFHTTEYIRRIRELSDDRGGDAGEFTPFGPGSYEIAKLAVGGVIVATDAVLDGVVDDAYVLGRPPGHHAERDRGRGFCIFANVALAAMHTRQARGLSRIAILDWDVHHGNGTQQAFYDDPHVLTISIHQNGLYPTDSGHVEDRGSGPGEGTNINVPLSPGSGEGAYTTVFEDIVEPAIRAFAPELIFVPSGFDASIRDPLGRMMLTAEAYGKLAKRIKALATDVCDGRLVLSHEGGYSKQYVPFCGLAVMEALTGIRTEISDSLNPNDLPGQELQPYQREEIDRIAAHVQLPGS